MSNTQFKSYVYYTCKELYAKHANVLFNRFFLLQFWGASENCEFQLNSLHLIYVEAAEESMSTAAAAIRKDDTVTDIVASFDGTWHKRGYVSLNGVVTCIERVNDKCIDVQVKTKDCKSCTFWEKKKGTAKYEIWKATHKCSTNHAGSASVMETAGTLEMFVRSIEKRKLRYITFIGDGDSSSYPSVVQADPYPGTVI